MDRQKALDELKIEQENCDIEAAHNNADKVLCRLLTSLGYADVVAEFEKVDKWYS